MISSDVSLTEEGWNNLRDRYPRADGMPCYGRDKKYDRG